MVDNRLLKDYLINATALGYNVHRAIDLGYKIKTEDDISNALQQLRNEDELIYFYIQKMTLDDIIKVIQNSKGVRKHALLTSLERQLKFVEEVPYSVDIVLDRKKEDKNESNKLY